MITSIQFGGLGKPAPKPSPRIAPTPVEHKIIPAQFIKNVQPMQIDE